jgi:hypothetical protein
MPANRKTNAFLCSDIIEVIPNSCVTPQIRDSHHHFNLLGSSICSGGTITSPSVMFIDAIIEDMFDLRKSK